MKEENKQPAEEKKKKIEAKPLPVDKEKTKEIEEKMRQEKKETAEEKLEDKVEEKSEKKEEKKKEIPKVKKEEAIARGAGLPISKKHSVYLCRFIKNKKIDQAISDVEKVSKFKQAVPFRGETPHRKGSMERGRYPIKASGYFINLLKALKGNAITNGLELETTRISIASASWARRQMRRGGTLSKRTNIILKAKEFPKKQGGKE
ncbi:MAG: hypothetical protein KJ600_04425 [Nanoarchaeota archaeon]|nr:hypothetical protein [Nanoarchaeota archaeon]MBU1103774.1 hypothetical protein [Nanoarchaeota archaeon]